MKYKISPIKYNALYKGELLPVTLIDYQAKRVFLTKQLPEKNTHITYVPNFDEVEFKRT